MTSTAVADLILVNGRLRTMDADAPPAEAIAVRGERIVAVGRADEALVLRGPRTRVVDLRGRTLLPGFGDAHCHPVSSGIDLQQIPLHDLSTEPQYLDAIAAWAAAHPDAPWILGGGWSMAAFPTGFGRRDALDRVTGERPAFFDSRDGHDGWVNSAALARAGVDRDAPDPPDGRIGRDPDGTPNGALHEGAQALVRRLMPPLTEAEYDGALRLAQATLHALGITAWQDAIVRPDEEAVYRRAGGRGTLTARVVGALWWDRHRGLEQIEDLVARRAAGPAGRFRPTSVKLMLDGIVENRSARLLEPYRDADGTPSTTSGLDLIDPAILHEAVTRLDALGFQCHFHAIGEGAVRLALDACETALRANGRTDGRHHVSHLQIIHPDDIGRFAPLGVLANLQPYWACASEQVLRLNEPILGPERSRWQYPFRSLARAGAKLAMGSDWAVSTPDPLAEMEVAITRVQHPERDTAPWLPDERLTLDECLEAFTAGSAFANHLDETGRLAPGFLADLAVLDRDLGAWDAGRLGDARVVGTLVGGAWVFEDPALEG